MTPLPVFDRRTLRERCTIHVRDLIISGDLKPGDHLVETRLSEQFGVSRGTLREALRPLVDEGLLVDDGRGHTSVRRLTAAEIRDVFAVRAVLENLAVTTLSERPDREELATQLRSALEPLRDDALPFAEQIAADLGFHELLCRLTGNATLLASWSRLIGQIEMMIIAVGQSVGSSRMRYDDHIGIVDAIAGGDPRAAGVALTAHMDAFADAYLRDFAS